jgi:hypothetical protein
MSTKTFNFEFQEHLSHNSRSLYFQVDGEDHGTSAFPFDITEALGPCQCGDRFAVEQEQVSDDEVVFRVKRLAPNPKNQPSICPFTARLATKTKKPSREAEHDPKRYRSLRAAYLRAEEKNEEPGANPWHPERVHVHVVCDDGTVRVSRIRGIEMDDGHGYVEVAGFPFMMHVSRVHLISKSPYKSEAA